MRQGRQNIAPTEIKSYAVGSVSTMIKFYYSPFREANDKIH